MSEWALLTTGGVGSLTVEDSLFASVTNIFSSTVQTIATFQYNANYLSGGSAGDDEIILTNNVFLTAEMTVPCLRHTQRLVKAIETEIGKDVRPRVIINRYAPKGGMEGGIRSDDVEELLGDQFAGGISNNYKLVREAVDRGVPLQEIDPNANVVQDLKRIILPEESQLETGRKRGFLGMGKGLLKKAG